jgi:hypothetical protein
VIELLGVPFRPRLFDHWPDMAPENEQIVGLERIDGSSLQAAPVAPEVLEAQLDPLPVAEEHGHGQSVYVTAMPDGVL